MPKRIPHLAEAIVERAAVLFSEHGYDAVDMKMVAAEAGTSVGNLYNYYPSKPALFIAIVQRWRNELLEACGVIMDGGMPRRETIHAVLRRLYDDVAQWHGLWREFMAGREERREMMELKARAKGPHLWGLGPGEAELLSRFERLVSGTPDPQPPYRWAYLVISATLQLAGRCPEARDENWKFIETLVDKI